MTEPATPEGHWNPMVPELVVSDFARSLEFYTDTLGFRVKFSRPNFAYLERDSGQPMPLHLMLEAYDRDVWLTGPLEAPFGRGINFQMEVDGVHSILERLSTLGYPLFRPLQEIWRPTEDGVEDGQLEFLIQDPDGYLLRFVQILGSRPREAAGS